MTAPYLLRPCKRCGKDTPHRKAGLKIKAGEEYQIWQCINRLENNKRCGKTHVSHSVKSNKDIRQRERIRKKAIKHPLKPWKDPESLFCDTDFLKDFLKKEPLKGKECKDDT